MSLTESCQNYHNSLVLLKSCQENITKLNERIKELECENMRLTVRGSYSYHELTPRHKNIKEFFAKHKLKEPIPNFAEGAKYTAQN